MKRMMKKAFTVSMEIMNQIDTLGTSHSFKKKKGL
jgi:hypothetical protein